jgi:hypothetical protein
LDGDGVYDFVVAHPRGQGPAESALIVARTSMTDTTVKLVNSCASTWAGMSIWASGGRRW